MPLGSRISYQRTPTKVPFLLPTLTEWFTTNDSWLPKLRYARRYIKRSPNESKFALVPGCGIQALPPQASAKGATAMLVGPVKVEFAGVAKSTWNFHRFSEFVPKSI